MRRRCPGSAEMAGQPRWWQACTTQLARGSKTPAACWRVSMAAASAGSRVGERDVGRLGQGLDQRFGRGMQRHRLAAGERGEGEAELRLPGDTEPGLHPKMTGGLRRQGAGVEDLASGGRGHTHAQRVSVTGW